MAFLIPAILLIGFIGGMHGHEDWPRSWNGAPIFEGCQEPACEVSGDLSKSE